MTYIPTPPRTFVFKTADQSRNSTTTVSSDSALSLSLSTGRYKLRGVIYVTHMDNAGLKFGIDGTNLQTRSVKFGFSIFNPDDDNAVSATPVHIFDSTDGVYEYTAGVDTDLLYRTRINIEESIIELTSSGTVFFKWAPQASVAQDVTVKSLSYLEAELVS